MHAPRFPHAPSHGFISVPSGVLTYSSELVLEARAQWLRFLSWLNAPFMSAGIVALAYIAFVALRLYAHGGDLSAFVYAGDHFANPAQVPAGLHVVPNSWGYDGQYYYALSLNPFTAKGRFAGLWIDNPPYRQQRILYPLAVWVLSLGGKASLVPALLVLVNVAAVIVLAWVGAVYAVSIGRHALWGLLPALYPGFVLALARDLPDALAVVLFAGSLVLVMRGRGGWASACLTLAVLTRETTVLVACAAALVLLAQWIGRGVIWAYAVIWAHTRQVTPEPMRTPRTVRLSLPGLLRPGKPIAIRIPWHYALVPPVALAAWQYVLRLRWHRVPALTGTGNVAAPLIGIKSRLQQLVFSGPDTYARVMSVETLFLLGIALIVALALWWSRAPWVIRVAWAATVALGIIAGPIVWGEDWGFLRTLADFFVLGALILVASAAWFRWVVLAGTVGMWCLLALTRFV